MWIVLLTILIFGLIIFLHECGHFVMAKVSGVKVNEFALGMGPKIFSFGKGETRYSLRMFPVGGYVSMEGEDEDSADERAFNQKPAWKRLLIVVAGATMNLILGFIVLCIMYLPQEGIATNQIHSFQQDAVSNQTLQAGDVILKINGNHIFTESDISFEMYRSESATMDFLVERDGEKLPLQVEFMTKPGEEGEAEQLYFDFILVGKKNSFFGGLGYSFRKAITLGRLVWASLGDLVTGKVGFDQLSGPVGVGTAVGEAASYGLDSVLFLVAFLTINVGIFNLLPLPALDGGRLLFILIEMIFRKPVPRKYEAYVHAVGLLLLLGLVVCITIKDIINLF